MEFKIVDRAVDAYIEKQYEATDELVLEMERFGARSDFPLVGPQVGRLLYILTRLLRAKRVFEMGSGYGYSAYWFAKALSEEGKVYQTEYSKEYSKKAEEFFKKGRLLDKTELLVGDALEFLEKIPGNFDIIFLDLDKEYYPAAFRKAKDRIRSGGLLIADNTLWFGRVLAKARDPETQGIQEFTRLLFGDKNFLATILPIRDGVAVGYKL